MSDSFFIEPSKWPADQDAWFTGLAGNQRVVSDQNLKKHKACILLEKDRNLFSLKPDPIDRKCNFGTARAAKQRLLQAWSLHMRVLWPNSIARVC